MDQLDFHFPASLGSAYRHEYEASLRSKSASPSNSPSSSSKRTEARRNVDAVALATSRASSRKDIPTGTDHETFAPAISDRSRDLAAIHRAKLAAAAAASASPSSAPSLSPSSSGAQEEAEGGAYSKGLSPPSHRNGSPAANLNDSSPRRRHRASPRGGDADDAVSEGGQSVGATSVASSRASAVSSRLYLAAEEHSAYLAKMRETLIQEELSACTFSPAINSTAISANDPRTIEQREHDKRVEMDRKRRELAHKLREEELAECTFQPELEAVHSGGRRRAHSSRHSGDGERAGGRGQGRGGKRTKRRAAPKVVGADEYLERMKKARFLRTVAELPTAQQIVALREAGMLSGDESSSYPSYSSLTYSDGSESGGRGRRSRSTSRAKTAKRNGRSLSRGRGGGGGGGGGGAGGVSDGEEPHKRKRRQSRGSSTSMNASRRGSASGDTSFHANKSYKSALKKPIPMEKGFEFDPSRGKDIDELMAPFKVTLKTCPYCNTEVEYFSLHSDGAFRDGSVQTDPDGPALELIKANRLAAYLKDDVARYKSALAHGRAALPSVDAGVQTDKAAVTRQRTRSDLPRVSELEIDETRNSVSPLSSGGSTASLAVNQRTSRQRRRSVVASDLNRRGSFGSRPGSSLGSFSPSSAQSGQNLAEVKKIVNELHGLLQKAEEVLGESNRLKSALSRIQDVVTSGCDLALGLSGVGLNSARCQSLRSVAANLETLSAELYTQSQVIIKFPEDANGRRRTQAALLALDDQVDWLSTVASDAAVAHDLRSALQNIPIVQQIDDPDVVYALIARMEHRVAAPGSYLSKAGEKNPPCVVVVKGEVSVVATDGKKVQGLKEGSTFGEAALTDSTPRATSAIADSYTEAYLLTKANVESALARWQSSKEAASGVLAGSSSTAARGVGGGVGSGVAASGIGGGSSSSSISGANGGAADHRAVALKANILSRISRLLVAPFTDKLMGLKKELVSAVDNTSAYKLALTQSVVHKVKETLHELVMALDVGWQRHSVEDAVDGLDALPSASAKTFASVVSATGEAMDLALRLVAIRKASEFLGVIPSFENVFVDGFLQDTAKALKFRSIASEETLTLGTGELDGLCMVTGGTLSVIHSGRKHAYDKGGFFGEALLHGEDRGHDTVTGGSNGAHVVVLLRSSLESLFKKYPAARVAVQANIASASGGGGSGGTSSSSSPGAGLTGGGSSGSLNTSSGSLGGGSGGGSGGGGGSGVAGGPVGRSSSTASLNSSGGARRASHAHLHGPGAPMSRRGSSLFPPHIDVTLVEGEPSQSTRRRNSVLHA